MGSGRWEIDRANYLGAIREPVMFRAGLLRSGVRQESRSASALILNLSRRTSSNTARSILRRSQLRLADKDFLARPKFFRAKDLKLSTTAARTRLLTTIPISDIGIWSTMSQAITEETLCLTADAGKMAIAMCASTSEISVDISAAVWETLGTLLASRSIPQIRSWNPGAWGRSYITKS
jgi:hypothetical protein